MTIIVSFLGPSKDFCLCYEVNWVDLASGKWLLSKLGALCLNVCIKANCNFAGISWGATISLVVIVVTMGADCPQRTTVRRLPCASGSKANICLDL